MTKAELKALWDKLGNERKALIDSVKDVKTGEELDAVQLSVRKLDVQIADVKAQYETAEADDGAAQRSVGELQPPLSPVTIYSGGNKEQRAENGDIFSTMEYRKAFMNYCTRGVAIPVEYRTDATTMTTDIGTVIPTNIMNEIIQKIRSIGDIYSRIRKTSMRGGVQYPTSSVIPTATWTAEGSVSEKQKKTTGSITFSYYKLQCRVAVSIEASVTALPVFEAQIVEDVTNAIIEAVEKSVISGTGSSQPRGIFIETTAAKAEISEDSIAAYKTYVDAYAKLKKGYKTGACWLMSQTDFDTNIIGMVDANGQPVARITAGVDGAPVQRLLGLPVITVDDDYITPFATASVGDMFGAVVNLGKYAFNSNMQITVKRYFDEDTDEWITKATLIGDGKMIDLNALVLLKKAAS